MPNRIYPDLTGSQFDIQYARLKALPSDLVGRAAPNRGSSGEDDSDDPPTTGQRFAVEGEDDLAAQEREFNLTGSFNFAIVNGSDGLFQIIGSSGQLVFGQYGEGVFEDTPVWALGVDALGNLIEYDPDGGSGVDNNRFGVSGEDDTAGENRGFDMTGGDYTFLYQGDSGNSSPLITAQGGQRGLAGYGSINGVYAESENLPLWATNIAAPAANIVTVFAMNRTGTGVVGMGQAMDMNIGNSVGGIANAGSIKTYWEDPTNLSEAAGWLLYLKRSSEAGLQPVFGIGSLGQASLFDYGDGDFLDTPAYLLGVNASGQIIEVTP